MRNALAGRRTRWMVLASLLALVIALGVTVVTVADTFGGPGFTPEGWRAAFGEEDPIRNDRTTMVSEVIDLLHPGMTRDAVLALLGPSESERDGMLVYEIGAAPFGVDTEALRVHFDASGRVTKADIEQR